MPEDNPDNSVTTYEVEGESPVEGTALTLDQLNSELGTRYQTVDAAIKGMKETKNFVGKAGKQQVEATVDPEKFITREQYEQDVFYSRNTDLEPYKDIINARAKDLGVRPAEAVVNDASLKLTLEKLRGYDKTESAKSVLMTNPRLGQVTDDMEKARESLTKGDQRNAEVSAVKAVTALFRK
jgi:hypothetical protein